MTSAANHDGVITGVILAGGRARRMGGEDKGLIEVAGRPMVSHVAERLRPQVGTLLVNANRNQARYAALTDCPVVADRVGDFAGPLAGMASAMQTMSTPLLLTVPCDSPLIASDLAARMRAALDAGSAEICVARDTERMQPVFALLRREVLTSLLAFLADGQAKIDRWFAEHRLAEADFSDSPEMFLNVNTPDERDALEQRLEDRRASTGVTG